MSKQYKGKTCVYCAIQGSSSTGDHVVARSFFSSDERDNLPQVPACPGCNTDKSALETYLAALLPQGARHQEDVSAYQAESRRRIDKNQKLFRELKAGAITSSEGGRIGKSVAEIMLPIDSSRLLELSKYIAKGLLFYHWQVIVPKDQVIHSQFMSDVGESNFDNLVSDLRKKAADAPLDDVLRTTGLVQLGRETVTYEGLFSPLDEPFSVWRLNFYRVMLGMPGVDEPTSSVMMLIPSKPA